MRPSPPSPRRPWWVALFALALASSPAPGQGNAPPTGPAEILRAAVRAETSPGAALLTIEAGGVRDELYFGRFHEDLLLPFGGASAWLSTATILTLVDAGRLELDDPLVKFFPQAPEDKAAITLRQILSHTAGLPGSHPCLAQPSSTLERCAGEILEQPLEGAPGQQFLFGAASLQLAGRVAEIAGGGPWRVLFRQRVAEPLGLDRTGYGPAANPSLASGARGTVRDYGRFLASLMPARAGSRPLLSTVLAVAMLTDQAAGATKAHWPLDEARGYGLGTWLVEDAAGRLWATAPGPLGFSPWLQREGGIAALVAVSARPADAAELRRRLGPLLQASGLPAPPREAPPQASRVTP